MVQGKTWLILIACIIGFTAIYLFYVKKEREASIARYLPQPQAGDVYKMEHRTHEDGHTTFYMQVKAVSAEGVYFYRGRMIAWGGANDMLLNHFDSSEAVRYSKTELQQIKQGKWDDDDHDYTTLLEITRK